MKFPTPLGPPFCEARVKLQLQFSHLHLDPEGKHLLQSRAMLWIPPAHLALYKQKFNKPIQFDLIYHGTIKNTKFASIVPVDSYIHCPI